MELAACWAVPDFDFSTSPGQRHDAAWRVRGPGRLCAFNNRFAAADGGRLALAGLASGPPVGRAPEYSCIALCLPAARKHQRRQARHSGTSRSLWRCRHRVVFLSTARSPRILCLQRLQRIAPRWITSVTAEHSVRCHSKRTNAGTLGWLQLRLVHSRAHSAATASFRAEYRSYAVDVPGAYSRAHTTAQS